MYETLQRLWYDDGPGLWPLLPLAWVYGAIVRLRRALYLRAILTVVRLPVPVIVVGNLTVGGTGKTPLVIWLARALGRRRLRVGIVSRGYGSDSGPLPLRVDAASDPRAAGDEPVLIARRTGCPVSVCRDRVAAANMLLDEGIELILSDDGLQHYRLGRDAEIVVLDGIRGLGNGHCLPAGPLREPRSRLAEVDALVVNGGAGWPRARLMQLVAGPASRLDGSEQRPLAEFAGQPVHAVAAIGHPRRFFDMLRAHGLQVIAHPHRDHARLDRREIAFDDELPVLMTEKDAVKCRAAADRRHWYVPVEVSFEATDGEDLIADLLRFTGVE